MSCQVNFPLQDIVLLLREKINPEIIGAVPEEKLEEEVLVFIQPKIDELQEQLNKLPPEVHISTQVLQGTALETTLNSGVVLTTDLSPLFTEVYNTLVLKADVAYVDGKDGDLSALLTTDKTSLVKAINEVYDKTKKATEFYVTPQMFAPKNIDIGDGVIDAYPYIKAALDTKYPVKLPLPSVKYRVTQNIIFNGHNIEGMASAPELYGPVSASRVIIEFDGVNGDAVQNINTLSTVKNIWFRQKDWSTQLNGLYLKRYAYFDDCMFTDFNGHGYYANAAPATISQNPFHTVFSRCQFLRNAKHGVGIFNGANAISIYDCLGRWNGAPSYGVAPTTADVWDGLYIDGHNADFPASSTKMEPQGLLVVGGDWSYNSRYGQNWHKAFDSTCLGGYIEGNLVSDMRVGASYSLNIVNPMTQKSPVLECVAVDSVDSSISLFNYANSIVVRGRDYGNGLQPVGANNRSYNRLLPAFYALGSSTLTRMYGSTTGAIIFEGDYPTNVEFKPNVAVRISRYRLGNVTGVTDATAGNYLAADDNNEGSAYFNIVTGGQYGKFSVGNGGGANAAASVLQLPKNSVTSRTINAGGTVNASGADYAEYMCKSADCMDIKKGEIVGVNKDGQLTKIYDDAISFVVKSTNPSYVGGDNWFTDVLSDDATDEQKAEFNKKLENARKNVDRVAFCGQVPIIYKANVGDYVIATRNDDGSIAITATQSPTFEQFLKCVGKVWYVNNGVAHIIIFNN